MKSWNWRLLQIARARWMPHGTRKAVLINELIDGHMQFSLLKNSPNDYYYYVDVRYISADCGLRMKHWGQFFQWINMSLLFHVAAMAATELVRMYWTRTNTLKFVHSSHGTSLAIIYCSHRVELECVVFRFFLSRSGSRVLIATVSPSSRVATARIVAGTWIFMYAYVPNTH